MTQFNRYGIKEVADVKLYKLDPEVYITGLIYDSNWNAAPKWSKDPGQPKFVFDSLKTSNIEVTAEETSAKGGRGNPELISWQYGKQATLQITDALFSMDTLGLMFGKKKPTGSAYDGVFETADGNLFADSNDAFLIPQPSETKEIIIDASSFPEYYTLIGITVMRRQSDGVDIPVLFYIPKAAIQVGGTLTMEAEGEPSTFEMTIKALAHDLPNAKNVLFQWYKASGSPGSISNIELEDNGSEQSMEFNGNINDSNGRTIPFDDSVTIDTIIEYNGQQYPVTLEYVEEVGE